jgi:hypothetical protein
MKQYIVAPLALILLLLAYRGAFASENATVTEDFIPLMKGPSFIAEELDDVQMVKGERVKAISRTSFTDRLAAVPEDYWYLVGFRESGALITGYIHGSALAVDPGVTIPIFDPPGLSVTTPRVVSGRYTGQWRIDARCVRTVDALIVPEGATATHFTIVRFDSSFTPCPGETYGSIIGFSIAPAADPGGELFSYEEHIADDPAELQHIKDGFYSFDLEPGNYAVDIRGGRDTILKLTYELVEAK